MKQSFVATWIQKGLEYLKERTFLKNILVVASGSSIAYGIVFLCSPLLAYLYTPQDMGTLKLYLSIVLTLIVVSDFRYKLAIPLVKKDGDAAHLLLLSLVLIVLFSLVLAIVCFVLVDQLVLLFSSPIEPWVFYLVPLGVIGGGVFTLMDYSVIRKKKYRWTAEKKIVQNVVYLIIALGLGWLRFGALGILLSDIVGRGSGAGWVLVKTLKQNLRYFKRISYRRMQQLMARFWKFTTLSSFGGLMSSLAIQAPPLIIIMYFGIEVGGWLGWIQQLLLIPPMLIGQAVSQVYYGETVQLKDSNPLQLRKLFYSTVKRLFLIGIIPALLLIFFGPSLFEIVFGSTWRMSGVYGQLLSMVFISNMVLFPISQTLYALERQIMQIVFDAGRLILIVSGVIIMHEAGLSDWYAILAFSITMTFSNIVNFILIAYSLNNLVSKFSKRGPIDPERIKIARGTPYE